MDIVFLSSYFNHHQKPLAESFFQVPGVRFCFIETKEMPEERKKLGYHIEYPKYVIPYDGNFEKNKQSILEKICDADVVISGSAPEWLLEKRKKQKKIIFRYSERPLKKGLQPLKYFPRYFKWHKNNPKKSSIYMLCASAYTASDYAKFGLFKNRCFKWGYFPELIKYDCVDKLIEEKEKNSIVWVGRFIDWKHPESAVKLAKRLKADGYDFKIKMIGNGILLEQIRAMITKEQVEDCVETLGAIDPERVRHYMEKAEIHIFTSDRQEGWGAVLNESMNSACVPVASCEIGAAPFLINNTENGLLYESKNNNDFYENVKYLLDNSKERKKMAKSSYNTILNEWNSKIAAERLLQLISDIKNNKKVMIEKGPCSKA